MTPRLPLPSIARTPFFFLGLAALHLYLGGGHVLSLFDSGVTWTGFWKGFGALAGVYYFLALALSARRPAAPSS